MRIAVSACVVSLCASSSFAQVDPAFWLPQSKLFGATTLERVDSDGTHSTYPVGVLARAVARNSQGDILVAETPGLGLPASVRVFRNGVGQVATLGPFGSINWIFVDAGDHLWLVEQVSFVTRQVRRVTPAGATQFLLGPDPFAPIGVSAQSEYVSFRQGPGTSMELRRLAADGSSLEHFVPFKFDRAWLAPSGDVVCAVSGSPTIRVVSADGVLKSTFDLPGVPTNAVAIEPGGALIAGVSMTSLVRFRLDGVPLASIPITGSDAVARVDPASDRTHWLLRVQQSSGLVTVQHVDYLGRIVESFVASLGDSFTAIGSSGDLTGAIRVSVNAPNEDSDLDGFVNASELELGSDPLDPASVPPTIDVNVIATSPTVLDFDIADAARPNQPYAVIAGLSAGDGVPVNGNEPAPRIPLSMLDVAQWIQSGGFTAAPLIGVLDGAGTKSFQLQVPHLPAGAFAARFTAITADPTGFIGGIAPAETVILP
ncbi:MAG: hypothetical protein IPH13_00840 [Planctomycetes bacterium]|nr:hypothetical protein [Planctomycetota bacterium]